MWNMQSGLHRKSFILGPNPSGGSRERNVSGLASDALNRVVVASTLDGSINVRRSLNFSHLFLLVFYDSSLIFIPQS